MGLYYLDTSALVKLYIREPGTDYVLGLSDDYDAHRKVILGLAVVEFRAAVRARQRLDLPAEMADLALSRFDRHLSRRFTVQPVNDQVIDAAVRVVDRCGLRAYDAMQLAGCLVTAEISRENPPTLVCSDLQVIEAAKVFGITVINPETQ